MNIVTEMNTSHMAIKQEGGIIQTKPTLTDTT